MKDQLIKRLESIEQEYQKGQNQLQSFELEAANLRTAMLRISGAIQVFKEELELEETSADVTSEEFSLSENGDRCLVD